MILLSFRRAVKHRITLLLFDTERPLKPLVELRILSLLACVLRLDPNFVREYLPPHTPVDEEAEPGICERGRLVVFEEEMTDLCKGVALHKCRWNQPPRLCDRGGKK